MENQPTINEYICKNQKKLRYGITTGSCAAAAAFAAAARLLKQESLEKVTIKTPKQITVDIPVYLESASDTSASFYVIKDSGDDPDVTNGKEVCARVTKCRELLEIDIANAFNSKEYQNIYIDGGTGIGRVTKPGLEQKVGQAAINTVPRQMIFEAVGELSRECMYDGILLVTISIPGGEEIAKKTFNERLGIEGGLSILGTSGIIEPMSERAIIDTIEASIRQLSNTGVDKLLITPGNYGQGYAADFLKLDLTDSVKCSNYIGDTLDLAVSYGMKKILLVGNIGKLVKLAAGIMNTHSKTADARGEIFGVHAAMCGAATETVRELMDAINTDIMLEILDKEGLRQRVLDSIILKIDERIKHRIGEEIEASVAVFSEKYGFLCGTDNLFDMVEEFKQKKV